MWLRSRGEGIQDQFVKTDLDTLATALYVKTDDLLKGSPQLALWRPDVGIAPKLNDAELVTLAVMQALLGFASEACYVGCSRTCKAYPQERVGGDSGGGAGEQAPERVRAVAGKFHLIGDLLEGGLNPVAPLGDDLPQDGGHAGALVFGGRDQHGGAAGGLGGSERLAVEALIAQQVTGRRPGVQQVFGDLALVDRGGHDVPGPDDPRAELGLDGQPEAVEPFGVRGVTAEPGGQVVARPAEPVGLDVWETCRELIPAGSVFAFLAEHREALFPAGMFADMYPSPNGRPSLPPQVLAATVVLQALDGLSDFETVQELRCDLRWKAACGLGLLDGAFDPSLLTYFRRRLGRSDDPDRLFAKVREVVAATGVLAGKPRRALDSTVLDDAVVI